MDAEKEKAAIEHLKRFEPKNRNEPYFLAYSGGKDSDCIKILAYYYWPPDIDYDEISF
jgi:3'-phosphoadenosine 5'-phosphosulfate sulfotransferase (PAPS reductase)/FAD synthetase